MVNLALSGVVILPELGRRCIVVAPIKHFQNDDQGKNVPCAVLKGFMPH